MRLEIARIEGRRNDLLLRIDRAEIGGARLSVANRERLMALPGMPRHRQPSAAEAQGIADAKLPIEAHLAQLGVVDDEGRARRRAIAISNRNLGTNHGHVAWQRDQRPRLFRILEDPIGAPSASFLAATSGGALVIADCAIDIAGDRLLDTDGRDAGEGFAWATVGQRVVRSGTVTPVEEIAAHFYDARHVLAFDSRREAGERIRQAIYDGYPQTFAANVLRAWREGASRARYMHNAVGMNAREVIVLQREGTIEEIGQALIDAGADDGVILDNGGSVACWVWWANDYRGGIISPTVDYRPPGTSAIVFELKGPMNVEMPGGSVSYSTY